MATITLRDTKGAPLTHDEVDANFTVLNDEKLDLKTGGTFEDNIKVNFGDDDDLQVYHDAVDTYIKNVTGELYILGDNITIGADDPNKPTFLAMDENGAVELFFNNTKKLETTTDGISILGTLTVDGAIVGGSVSGDLGDATVTSLTSSGTVSAPLFAGGAITCTTLTSTGDISSGGDVSVAGGVNTTGDVTANGSINGGAITSSGTIVSQGAITAGGDVTVTGALSVTDAETTRVNLNVDQAGEALAFAIALG